MKKLVSILLVSVLLLSCLCGVVLAVDTYSIQSSLTISDYSSELMQGDDENEIRICYDVTSSGLASSIGVESIKIYRSSGGYVTTIYGLMKTRFHCVA